MPARRDAPRSRSSTAALARLVGAQPDAPGMRPSTVWRLLDRDARKPWRHRAWITVRDPDFAARAGRVLDLYEGMWAGRPLAAAECVRSADEQTSSQARLRRHPTTPPGPHQPARVEHEYARGGARAYLAAWAVRRGGALGRGAATTGSAPCGRRVDQVMRQEPDRAAPRVCWIVDNGSSHRGAAAVRRRQARYPNLVLVHLPTHASWLNQIELSFSIVQRTALTPNAFPDLAAVERRLLACEARDHDTAVPFHWRFSRADLDRRLAQLPAPPRSLAPRPAPQPPPALLPPAA